MGIFDEKESFSRRELRETLRRSSGVIPKTGGKRYSQEERVQLEKKTFGKKFGGNISERDFKGGVRDLKSAGRRAETKEEKRDIKRGIDYLKRLGDLK